MQTIIIPESMHEIDIDEDSIAKSGVEPRSDTLNAMLGNKLDSGNLMVSGVFAFNDTNPIRYRRTFRNNSRAPLPESIWYNSAQSDFVNDDTLNQLLMRWFKTGKGDAILTISQRSRPNLYELFPHKEGEDYFFYNGRYGTTELWSTVRNARIRKQSIPKAVYTEYAKHFYKSNGDILHHDSDDFREKISYENEDGMHPRIYRAFIWRDGKIIHDDNFTDGFSSGMRRSVLRHQYVGYQTTDSDIRLWSCY